MLCWGPLLTNDRRPGPSLGTSDQIKGADFFHHFGRSHTECILVIFYAPIYSGNVIIYVKEYKKLINLIYSIQNVLVLVMSLIGWTAVLKHFGRRHLNFLQCHKDIL